MRMFLLALLALVVITGIAGVTLTALRPAAADAYRSPTGSVRI